MGSDLTGEIIENVVCEREFLRLQIDTRGGRYLEVENDFTVTHGEALFDSRTEADQAVAAIRAWVSSR